MCRKSPRADSAVSRSAAHPCGHKQIDKASSQNISTPTEETCSVRDCGNIYSWTANINLCVCVFQYLRDWRQSHMGLRGTAASREIWEETRSDWTKVISCHASPSSSSSSDVEPPPNVSCEGNEVNTHRFTQRNISTKKEKCSMNQKYDQIMTRFLNIIHRGHLRAIISTHFLHNYRRILVFFNLSSERNKSTSPILLVVKF